MLLKKLAQQVVLLVFRGLHWERLGTLGKFRIRNLSLRIAAQAIDPIIAYSIRELLLLAPENVFRQVWPLGVIKSLAQDILLQSGVHAIGPLLEVDHLLPGVDVHAHVKERFVQERNTSLQTPGLCRFVGPQHIPLMKSRRLTDQFLLHFHGPWGLVEVQVPTENLVCTLAREHHLDPQGLDLAGEKVHRNGSTDLVPRLQMPDQVRQRVQGLFHRESKLMMNRVKVVSHCSGSPQVRGILDANGEGVHTGGPPQHVECLNAMANSNGGDERAVQPTRQQNTTGNVSHQTLDHGLDQGRLDSAVISLGLWHVPGVHPDGVVPAHQFTVDEGVAWREFLVGFAVIDEALHFRGKPNRAISPMAPVKRADAHVVTCCNNVRLPFAASVDDDKGEHAIQHGDHTFTKLPVQETHDFRVTGTGEQLVEIKLTLQLCVVVNLAIHHPHNLPFSVV
mmetsp:Transcript_91067/g.152539  ORF Transcript_91067/g.152539 Transcript_91067/m.152539 type:complete len:450 (-) Transcript_91067:301-1650(-)